MVEILKNSARHKLSKNEDSFINVELSSLSRELMETEDSYVVDAYKQYFKEKDKSQNYRLAFTITPYCSNVLFNMVTEPVYKEGSSECYLFTNLKSVLHPDPLPGEADERASFEKDSNMKGYLYYCGYSALTNYKTAITLNDFIEDTGFSHPNCGAIKYHCGFDIFNNHYPRKRGFVMISRLLTAQSPTTRHFNSIKDFAREADGETIKNSFLISDGSGGIDDGLYNMPLYRIATIDTYYEAISNNLTEENGWFGFRNKSTFPIKNYYTGGTSYLINKCMNDREGNDFIDMYPDRTLYSFVPKYNEYRKRIEPNWDYCITYPFSSDTNNYLIESPEKVNGIKAKIATSFNTVNGVPLNIVFKTFTKHNLNPGDFVSITFISYEGEINKTGVLRVVSTGINEGEDMQHYFSVKSVQIQTYILPSGEFIYPKDIRVSKCIDGVDCKYYARLFKTIGTYVSQMNKLAFAQNAYSDQVAQVVFTEDIVTDNVVDNLNRPISELYFTIVKRNKGYQKWYSNNIYNTEDIEFSHCFGKITSGFDLPTDNECRNYNVHRIHCVPSGNEGITNSPLKLEGNITIDGGISADTFYGDIVEFSPTTMSETVLEPVYHRFNTAQREAVNDLFSSFTHTELTKEVNGGNTYSTINVSDETGVRRVNLIPEGYFYKPHHLVRVRNFGDEVNVGYHIKVGYEIISLNMPILELRTDKNYYFQSGSTEYGIQGSVIYLYSSVRGKYYQYAASGVCVYVSEDFKTVRFRMSSFADISNVKIFKHNTEMPDYAYDFKDGTGKYAWRDIMPFNDVQVGDELYDSQFTNGAHYHHKNISFYLKRQDPDGIYGIGKEPAKLASFKVDKVEHSFLIENVSKDVSNDEYKIDNGNIKC